MGDGGDVGYSFPVLNSKQIVGYLSDVHIHVAEEVIRLTAVVLVNDTQTVLRCLRTTYALCTKMIPDTWYNSSSTRMISHHQTD